MNPLDDSILRCYTIKQLFGNPSQSLRPLEKLACFERLGLGSVFYLSLLGNVQVEHNGAPVQGFESRKALALLCYLAVRAQPLSRTHLADLFWGDKSEAHGRGNLSRVFHNLTTLLPDSLQIDRDTVQLKSGLFWLDVQAFDEFAAQDMPEALASAVELYHDEFMAGFFLDNCPEFEIWLVTERERWRQRAARILYDLLHHYAERGEYDNALRFTSRLLVIEPWREEARRQMMHLLALAGQRKAALSQYETCRRILKEEMGVEPTAETTALYRQIKAGGFAPAPPRRLTQPNNLPAQVTSFVGRETELAAIEARLDSPECRLLTLVGPPGIGKTRLALEAAGRRLDAFRDGAYFVALTPLNSPEFIVSAIANALKFRFSGSDEPKEQLLNYLQRKEMLLVLDNFEHLLAGADLVTDILERAPTERFLVTSRERLNFQAECLLHIQGLSFPTSIPTPLPSGEEGKTGLEAYGAVQLFVERARRVDEQFLLSPERVAAVIRICQLVDGMPLAIELAAAGVERFPVQVIAEQIARNLDFLKTTMRDVEPRHRSFRAVLDWSYALLADAERTLLQWLSVFAGGWTFAAAEAVCAGRLPKLQIFDLLNQLVDKSLVLAEREEDDVRYRLLQTVREYAHEHLTESGEAEPAQARHFEYFPKLAELAEPQLISPEQMVWLKRFEVENNNLRAALERSERGDSPAELGLRLAGALWRFWYMRGYSTEGYGWLQRVLERSAGAPPALKAKALTGIGYMAWCQGHYDRAKEFHQEALTLYRQVDDKWGVAFALHNIGAQVVYEGRYEEGRVLFEESLAIAREIGNNWLLACILTALGESERYLGHYERAIELQEESLSLSREVGDQQLIALSLTNLGLVASAQNDYLRARELLRQSLGLYWKNGEKRLLAECIEELAKAVHHQGQPKRAARLFGAAEILRESINHPLPPPERADYERSVAAVRAGLTQAAFQVTWAEGRAMTLEEAIKYALEDDRKTK